MTAPTFARSLILPKRRKGSAATDTPAWLYDDEHVQSAAVAWGLAYGFNLGEFDSYLDEPGWDTPKARENHAQLVECRARALHAWRNGDRVGAVALIKDLQAAFRRSREREVLLPLARKGVKFTLGRKVGTIGPVRAAVRRMLKRFPAAAPAEIWARLVESPPKGMALIDSPCLGKYIETDGRLGTSYARFANIVSEEKGSK